MLSSGVGALQNGIKQMAVTADNISKVASSDESIDLNTEAVNMLVHQNQALSAIKVVETADKMLGSLIDTEV
jgi:flagellar hook protein FlgE